MPNCLVGCLIYVTLCSILTTQICKLLGNYMQYRVVQGIETNDVYLFKTEKY